MPLGSAPGQHLFLELPGSSAVQEVEDDDNLAVVTCGYRYFLLCRKRNLFLILLLIFFFQTQGCPGWAMPYVGILGFGEGDLKVTIVMRWWQKEFLLQQIYNMEN
jgi:hypothetical protein